MLWLKPRHKIMSAAVLVPLECHDCGVYFSLFIDEARPGASLKEHCPYCGSYQAYQSGQSVVMN